MRESHFRTPRTLADCEFRVGYPIAEPRRSFEQLGHTAVAYTLAFAAGFVVALVALT